LEGELIPLEARLLAIADAFDAMVSARPYRRLFTHERALFEIGICAGSQFDPVLAEAFVDVWGERIDAVAS
jgi:HD-GYP domain-containing protein (c-di-GMP phosphodiesterase class II)